MYLSKIIIENFQAFERGEFNLSANLNILVGVSNVGKSSVSRALSLVLFNQWDKSWVRFGSKYCRVTVQTNTGTEIIREKGEKVNRYILRLPGQDEQLFESFGTSVPEVIQQILKIHEVQIDALDTLNLNLAGQMDSLFLLSQTGSYRAKVLGALSGATYLDFAIRELNKDKRQTTAEKNSKELEFTELQVQLDNLAPIEAYKSQIAEIEAKLASISTQEARLERIRGLFKRVKALKQAWAKETAIEALVAQVRLDVFGELESKVDNVRRVSLLFSKIVNLSLTKAKQDKLKILLATLDLTTIYVLLERSIKLKKSKDLFNRVIKNQKELASKTNELEYTEQKYNETKEQYSAMLRENEVCPMCNSNTKDLCEQ